MSKTINVGKDGIVIITGQGGGEQGSIIINKPDQPTLSQIISGSERAVLWKLIDQYLEENPDALANPDELSAAIAKYLNENPAVLNNAISDYLLLNPQGLKQADVERIVKQYLVDNPPDVVSPEDIEAQVNAYLAANPAQSYRTFSSWAALSGTKPVASGERVLLNDYNGNTAWSALKNGSGGWMVGYLTNAAGWKTPDGGYFAGNASDKTYYWRRELLPDDLNVLHFGAVDDGVTDASPAIMAMFDFMRSAQTRAIFPEADMLPVRFPSGRFMVKPMDFTTKGTVSSAATLLAARQKVAWRENGLRLGNSVGSGKGLGTNGADVSSYDKIDIDYVKASRPELYLEFSAQENHNGYDAIGAWGITGPEVNYGRAPQTTIVSDSTADTYVFEVRAIRVTMQGIAFEGGGGSASEMTNWGTNGPKPGITAPKSNQGFFKNWRSEGQYYDVKSMQMLNVGGRSFDMVDTLDAKFDQIYSNYCWDSVIYGGWSNAVTGVWDHGTALELTNSHFENHLMITPPVYTPRCAQMLIRNVWIEKCVTPAVIHDAAMSLDTFCVEACDNPVYAIYSRDVMTIYSAPTGVAFDTTTQPYTTQPALTDDQSTWKVNPDWKAPIALADSAVYSKYNSLYIRPKGSPIKEWLSAYERGLLRLENYGVKSAGPIAAGMFLSGTISNPYPEARWVCVGMNEIRGNTTAAAALLRKQYAAAGKTAAEISAAVALLTLGTGIEITIYNSRKVSVSDGLSILQNAAPGKTVIRRKRAIDEAPVKECSYFHEGDTLIQDVAVSGWGNTKVWVKLPANSGEYAFVVTGGGATRFEAGACCRWEPGKGETVGIDATTGGFAKGTDGKIVSDLGNTLNDSGVLIKQWGVNVGKAGIGLTNLGTLSMTSVVPTDANKPTSMDLANVGKFLTVSSDGTNYYLPLYKKNGT